MPFSSCQGFVLVKLHCIVQSCRPYFTELKSTLIEIKFYHCLVALLINFSLIKYFHLYCPSALLPHKEEILHCLKRFFKCLLWSHTHSYSHNCESRVRGWGVRGQPFLHSKFKTSLGYVRSSLKKTQENK